MARRAEQVVRISRDVEPRRRGSGYLIAPGLLLTARHVLDGIEDHDGLAALRVSRLTGGDLTVSEIIRPTDDALDVALLRVRRDESEETPMIAVADVEEPVQVWATGFPRAQRQGEARDPEHVRGMADPLSGPDHAISVDVDSGIPADADGWSGFSGAALFTVGGALLGVVATDHRAFGGRRLEAVPIDRLLDDSGLRDALPVAWRNSAPRYLSSLLTFRIGPDLSIRVRSFEPLMTTALRETLLVSWLKPLRAEHQLVPFIGRERAFTALSGWLSASGPRFSFAVVTGPAGSGKSRMAAELCRRAITGGWVAGLTRVSSTPAAADLANLRVPVLLVQDYMDNGAEAAAILLERAMVAERKEPIRILFLVRSADRFLENLSAEMHLDYLEPAQVIRLNEEELTADERREHYEKALAAFAALRGVERPIGRAADQVLAALPTPLLVHAQALIDLLDEPDEADDAEQDELAYRLLDRLLWREDKKFWKPALAEYHLSRNTREDCFAIATMVDARSPEDAGRLLALARGLSGELNRVTRIAERMSELYADQGFLPSVQPDLLGEHLIERCLLDSRKIDELFALADTAAQRSAMLEILLRMCGSPYPATRQKATAAVDRILAVRLTELVRQAIAVNSAPSDPAADPLPIQLATALSLVEIPAAASEAARIEFPMGSRLQALAAVVYEQAALRFERTADQEAQIDMLHKATLARLNAGQPDAALPLSARMMKFATALPGMSRQQRFGRILGSQSLVQVWTGNIEGAVDSAQRSVLVTEEAARSSDDPDRFTETLAESRSVLAQTLMAAMDPYGALEVIEGAVAAVDRLPAKTAVEVLTIQAMLGMFVEDLPLALSAAARARNLCRPGSEQHVSHTGLLAALHSMTGDVSTALQLAVEAVDAVDALPNRSAEEVRYRSAAVRFAAAQVFADHDEAVAERYLGEARGEMLRLYDHSPDLYGLLAVMTRLLWAMFRPGDQAVREISAAAGMVDELFQKRPGVHWGMLVPTVTAQIIAYTRAGRPADAIRAVDETVAKMHRYPPPAGPVMLAELLGIKALVALEDLEDGSVAFGSAAEARRIYEDLVADDPLHFLSELVQVEMLQASALRLSGHGADALRTADEVVRDAERFLRLSRTDDGRRLRARALVLRGRLYRDSGLVPEALADFHEAHAGLRAVAPVDEDEIGELDELITEMQRRGVAPARAARVEPVALPTPEEETMQPIPPRGPQDDLGARSDVPAEIQQRAKAQPEAEPIRNTKSAKAVVAIDFGTHGSGFAYALISPQDDDPAKRTVYSRQNWPKSPGGVKDLSAVVVDDNLKPFAWGYEAYALWQLNSPYKREGLHLGGYAYGFKMALSTRAANRVVARSEGHIDLDSEPMVRRLITSMLRYMREHAATALQRDTGVSEQDVRWCITVPAIWSNSQKTIMRKAAQDAGLGPAEQVLIAIEPETAALYVLLDARRRNADTALRDGTEQRIMIVDCGGGTIDISAFKGTMDGGQLRLAEIGAGSTGAALGSQYINHAFRHELLPERLGDDTIRELEEAPDALLSKLEIQWEKRKQHVGVASSGGPPRVSGGIYLDLTEQWEVLPGAVRRRLIEAADGQPFTLYLRAEEVQKLFDGVLDPLVRVVRRAFDELREHLKGEPVTVVLVGGFSHNDYLHARIAEELAGEADVIRPTEPREAVLHGAVHFCYDPKLITQRRARLTYGFQMALPFRSGSKDLQHDIVRGPEQQMLVRDRFKITVRRSQSIEVDQRFSKVLTPYSSETRELRVTFFACRRNDPEYVTDDDVVKLDDVVIDISSSVGRPPADRKVELEMIFGDTVITASVTALDTGIRQNIDIPLDAHFDDPDQAETLGFV
ncbi:trypsin-like peptidase domain-containing protein [Actinoplanes missouriensis]|uniref:trypsin-like peptidase domain-containing protein n=1 Tax=Actinoplanes missouriensis TaxID=1866 RepID=UPI0033ED0769